MFPGLQVGSRSRPGSPGWGAPVLPSVRSVAHDAAAAQPLLPPWLRVHLRPACALPPTLLLCTRRAAPTTTPSAAWLWRSRWPTPPSSSSTSSRWGRQLLLLLLLLLLLSGAGLFQDRPGDLQHFALTSATQASAGLELSGRRCCSPSCLAPFSHAISHATLPCPAGDCQRARAGGPHV